MDVAALAEIVIYPVKSSRALPLADVAVGRCGLVGDRDWLVVDAADRFVSQRTMPALATLVARPLPDGIGLADALGRVIDVPRPVGGAARAVTIWDDVVTARDAGDAAAFFLSDAFGRPLRLVWMPADAVRPTDPAYAGREDVPVSFADGFPLLVTNEASLDDLNRRLPESVPMSRFRPNLVVRGWPPFAEDRVRRIRCAGVDIDLVKPCTRCVIPSLDPLTGAPALDPTPALKAFRYDRTLRGVTFGVNAVVTQGVGRVLRVGDRVEVLETY